MVLGGYSQGAAVMGFVTDNAVPDGVNLVQALQPMPPAVGAAGHKYVAKCGAQSGKQTFLVFKTRAECVAEHDAEPAQPEPAE